MATNTDNLTDSKQIRALFWAWKFPSLNRHQTILDAPDVDPVVAAAWQVIQGGAAAIWRVTDPAVEDLLSIVDALPMPSKLAMEYAAGRNVATGAAENEETYTRPPEGETAAGDVGGRLARELLGEDAALAWPDVTPGAGEWPKYPQHTCGAKTEMGTFITFRPREVEAIPTYTPKWHDCPACYHARIKRYASQILWELSRLHEDGRGLVVCDLDSKEALNRFAGRVRKQRERKGIEGGYCAYPQEDGRFFVVAHSDIANLEGEAMPYNKPDIYRLVYRWAKTPEGRRVSPSEGWGGPFQGSKGDGRKVFARKQGEDPEPNKQLWTKSGIGEVAAALGRELRPRAKSLRVQIDPLEAYQKLTTAGIELHERKTNRTGLNAILDLVGVDVEDSANVTHKGDDLDLREEISLMRDIAPQTALPADVDRLDLMLEIAFGGEKWNYR